MASVECPQCHKPAAKALGKTYCPLCGWNREAAEKQTRLLLKLLPVLVILFDAPLIIWILTGHSAVSGIGLFMALAIVPALLVVLAVRRTAGKVLAPARPVAAVTSKAGATAIAAPSEDIAEQYTALLELQQPRPVRMSPRGRASVTITGAGLLLFGIALMAMALIQPAAVRANITPIRRALLYIVPVGIIALMAGLTRRGIVRERQLLALGKVAMARVTKQWSARNGSGIQYAFTAESGETFSRMTTDYSQQLFEGMMVPIFYDPQEPQKQVALCASFYEIAARGKK